MLGWYGGPGLAQTMRTFTKDLHLPSAVASLVIAGEFLGGIGLMVGLCSRIAALVIAVTMVGARGAFSLDHIVHERASRSDQPVAVDTQGR